MALLTVQQVSIAGLEVALTAAAELGDTFLNNGRTSFRVANGSVAAITVTIDSLVNCSQGYDHNIVVSVPAGDTYEIGPFPPDRFNSSAGIVTATYSAFADLTVGAVSL